MSWGIRLDQRHLTEEATQGGLGELTPFGLSLIVGLELIVVGTLLSP